MLLVKSFRHSIFHFLALFLLRKHQGQFTEEQILDNNENSPMFEEFLQLLGDKVRLRGFDKYKGGLGKRNITKNNSISIFPRKNGEINKSSFLFLIVSSTDTVHDLTGLYSVYTNWRNIEIMFHVSTQLPYERHDPQKLQRKRHIGEAN